MSHDLSQNIERGKREGTITHSNFYLFFFFLKRIFWTKTQFENFQKYYIPTSVLLCFLSMRPFSAVVLSCFLLDLSVNHTFPFSFAFLFIWLIWPCFNFLLSFFSYSVLFDFFFFFFGLFFLVIFLLSYLFKLMELNSLSLSFFKE